MIQIDLTKLARKIGRINVAAYRSQRWNQAQVAHWCKLMAGCLGCCLLCGCGDTGPRRYAAKGRVTLDGQPVDNATLIMTPKGKGLAAAALIHEGSFEFAADAGPSAGEFGVRINPNEGEIEETAENAHPPKANSRPRIPKIYQRDGSLNAKITGEPDQSLVFELSSKPK